MINMTEEIEDIKQQVKTKQQVDLEKNMQLVNAKAEIIAEFSKTIYVAEKAYYKQKQASRQAK